MLKIIAALLQQTAPYTLVPTQCHLSVNSAEFCSQSNTGLPLLQLRTTHSLIETQYQWHFYATLSPKKRLIMEGGPKASNGGHYENVH